MNNHRYYTTKGLHEGGGNGGGTMNTHIYVLEANMKDLISRMNMMDTQISKLYTIINKLESSLGNKMTAAYNLLPLNETGESRGYTTEHENYVFAYPNMVKGSSGEAAGNEIYPIYLSPRIKYTNRTEDSAVCPVVNSDLFIAEYEVRNPNDVYDIDGKITLNTTNDFRDEKIIPIEYHFTPSDIKARNYNIDETYEGSGVNDVKFGDNMTISPYNVNIINNPDIQYNEYNVAINKDTLVNKNIQESNISLIKGVYTENDEFDKTKKYERTGMIAQTVDSTNARHNFTAQYPNKAWYEMNKNNFDESIPIPEEEYETKLTVKNEERLIHNNSLEKTTTSETIITPESVMVKKQDSTETNHDQTLLYNDRLEFQTISDDVKVDGKIYIENINDKDYVRIDDNLTTNGELRIKNDQNQSFTTINNGTITSTNNETNSSSVINGGNITSTNNDTNSSSTINGGTIISSDLNETTKTTIDNGTITSTNNGTNSSSVINGGTITSFDLNETTNKTTINNGTITSSITDEHETSPITTTISGGNINATAYMTTTKTINTTIEYSDIPETVPYDTFVETRYLLDDGVLEMKITTTIKSDPPTTTTETVYSTIIPDPFPLDYDVKTEYETTSDDKLKTTTTTTTMKHEPTSNIISGGYIISPNLKKDNEDRLKECEKQIKEVYSQLLTIQWQEESQTDNELEDIDTTRNWKDVSINGNDYIVIGSAHLSPSVCISNVQQTTIGSGNWVKIIKCNDRFIVIGKETTKALIYYDSSASASASTWEWKLSNEYDGTKIISFNDICRFRNNSCAAVGNDNYVYIINDSTDDWTPYGIGGINDSTNNNWLSIASLHTTNDDDYLMTVSEDQKYAIYQDGGEGWDVYSLTKINVPISVASGHSSFIILFGNGYVALFSDLSHFASYSTIKIDDGSFTSLTYTGNRFIASSTSSIYYSVNGRDWFNALTPNIQINNIRYFNPSIYLCCNSNTLIKSHFIPSLVKSTLQEFGTSKTWTSSESNSKLVVFFDSSTGFIKNDNEQYIMNNLPIQNISSVALSDDGTKLYASNNRPTTGIYDLETKTWTTTNHPIDINFIVRYTDTTNKELFAYINKSFGILTTTKEDVLYSLSNAMTGELHSCFANDKFVVLCENGLCGCITYRQYSQPSVQAVGDRNKTWKSICFGNNTFIAVAYEYNKCAYSNDGTSWTEQDIQSSAEPGFDLSKHHWTSICFDGSMFVAITSDGGHIATTTNGQTWSYLEITSTISTTINSLTFGNGEYIAAGENGYVLKLELELDPTENTLVEKRISLSSSWRCIHYDHSKFVVGGIDEIGFSSSFDSDWTIKSVSDQSIQWSQITSSPHLFILSNSANNSYIFSSDCENWMTSTFTGFDNNCSVCYGKNNEFLNIGQMIDNSTTETNFYVSKNINSLFPSGFEASEVVWANGNFVAIGNFDHFLTKDSESFEWSENETEYPESFGEPTKICPQGSSYMFINDGKSVLFNNDTYGNVSNLSSIPKQWKKLIYLNGAFIAISGETIAYTNNYTDWKETNIITNGGNNVVIQIDTITTDGSKIYIADSSNIYVLNDISTVDSIKIDETIKPDQTTAEIEENYVDTSITTNDSVCRLNENGTIKINVSKQWYHVKPIYINSIFEKFITNENQNMIFGRVIEPITDNEIPIVIYSTNVDNEWKFSILPSTTSTITAWNVVWFDQHQITYATAINRSTVQLPNNDGILYFTTDGKNWSSYAKKVSIPTGKRIHNIVADDSNIGVFFNDSNISYYISANDISSNWILMEDDRALTFKTIVYGGSLFGLLEGNGSTQFIYTKSSLNHKWRVIQLPMTDKWIDMTYFENKYIIISDSKNSLVSPDGLSWENVLISQTNRNWTTLKKKSDSVVAINDEFSFFAYGSFPKQTLDSLKLIILETIYPIGSIYSTLDNSINTPRDVLGFGTWSRIENKFLFGIGENGMTYKANNNDKIYTDTTKQTGGEFSHALTVEELASHGHGCEGSGSHSHYLNVNDLGNDHRGIALEGQKNTEYGVRNNECANDGWHTHTIYNTGSNYAHENMPPFITIKMWERTA